MHLGSQQFRQIYCCGVISFVRIPCVNVLNCVPFSLLYLWCFFFLLFLFIANIIVVIIIFLCSAQIYDCVTVYVCVCFLFCCFMKFTQKKLGQTKIIGKKDKFIYRYFCRTSTGKTSGTLHFSQIYNIQQKYIPKVKWKIRINNDKISWYCTLWKWLRCVFSIHCLSYSFF